MTTAEAADAAPAAAAVSPAPGAPVPAFREGAADQPARARWNPALEGMRAVAALAVLVTHVSFRSGFTGSEGSTGGVMARLEVGVALFFILSGYLLYRPFAAAALDGRTPPRAIPYLRRRALRILPAYWVLMIVVLLAFNAPYLDDWSDWAIPLGLLQIYAPLWIPVAAEHTWSLATEVAFYAALPLLAWAARALGGRTPRHRIRRQFVFVAVLTVTGPAYLLAAHAPWWPFSGVSQMWLPAYLSWFGVGMGLAVLASVPVSSGQPWRTHTAALATTPAACWGSAAALLWIASTPLFGPRAVYPDSTAVESTARNVVYALVGLLLLLPLVAGSEPASAVKRVLENRPVQYLGRISYGVFLWHMPILEACFRVTGIREFSGHFWPLLAATFTLSVIAASISYYLLERPFQRLR
jgi:peptidoglycan/LPS O-acetylase OafA/YrhL